MAKRLMRAFCQAAGSVAQIRLRSSFPFLWTNASYALGLGRSEGCEAVQDCGPDLQVRHLPVEVTCHDALAE